MYQGFLMLISFLKSDVNIPEGGGLLRWHFLESDLIPYIEPPKFRAGDKVVPIGILEWLDAGKIPQLLCQYS